MKYSPLVLVGVLVALQLPASAMAGVSRIAVGAALPSGALYDGGWRTGPALSLEGRAFMLGGWQADWLGQYSLHRYIESTTFDNSTHFLRLAVAHEWSPVWASRIHLLAAGGFAALWAGPDLESSDMVVVNGPQLATEYRGPAPASIEGLGPSVLARASLGIFRGAPGELRAFCFWDAAWLRDASSQAWTVGALFVLGQP